MPLQPGRGKQHQLEWPWSATQVEHLEDMLTTLFKRTNSLTDTALHPDISTLIGVNAGDVLYGSAPDTVAGLAIGAINTVLTSTGALPGWALLTNANIDAAAAIAWTKINKAGSSLADLTTRSAADLSSGTLLAARMPALTGDITSTVGTVATTLATVNANVGTFGSATQAPQITVNAKGLITAAANVTVTPTGMVTGSGTSGKFAKWTGTSTIGDALLSESGTLLSTTAANLSLTGPAIASVSVGSGTAAVAVLALSASAGGATSAGSGVVTGGAGGSFTVTTGIGGGITGTPGTGTGGAGGDVTFVAGDGGLGTTFGGRGGRIEFTAGGAGNGTGVGAPGYLKLAGGAAATVGNNNGGDVYVLGGGKNGSGADGNVLLCLSPSFTVRGVCGIATATPAARLSINGGCHVGGDSDPGDNNLSVDGTGLITGDFTVGASKFTVTAAGGDVSAAGGVTMQGQLTVGVGRFIVLPASGNTSVLGTLGVGSDFAVATTLFTVAGASGNTVVAGTLGVTGIATFTAAPVFSSGTASQTVELTAGKALTTAAITGTGNYVKSASPTLTGTITAAAMNLSGTLASTAALISITNASAELQVKISGGLTMTLQPGFFGTSSNDGFVLLLNNGTAGKFHASKGFSWGDTTDPGASNARFAGTLTVVGASSVAALSASGDFAVATSKFTVASASGNTLVAGTLNVTSDATFAAKTIYTGISALSLVFDGATKSNDKDPGAGTIVRVTSTVNSGNALLTGLTGGTDGRMLILWNTHASLTLSLMIEDTGSSAANRFGGQAATSDTVGPGQCCMIVYDGTSSRWRPR